MLFIRQSPMLLSTACRVSLPRLGVRALAGRTTEVSRDLVKVRLPKLGSEAWLARLQHGEETVVEIPLPRQDASHTARAICCHGLATAVVSPTSLRLEIQVARLSIRDQREPARGALSVPAPLKMRKGAGR
jgi:hypothetical protein